MKTISGSPSLRNRLIMSVGALLILVGVAGYFVVIQSQHHIIEQQALTVAKIVAKHANAARSVYNTSIVQKVTADKTGFADIYFHEKKGGIPLPAQFLKNVAGKASRESDGLYEYRAVSKWNLAPDQDLNNAFLKTAWKDLEKQGQTNFTLDNWQPYHSVTKKNGQEIFMYLEADLARSVSCVNCHNAYEQKPEIIERRLSQGITPEKRWRKNELLGAFYVQIPLNGIRSLAIKQSTESIIWIVAILTGGLIVLAFFLLGDVAKANRFTRKLFWQARHDSLTSLPNRLLFEETINELIANAKETGNSHYMCFLDLDRFKIVNDTAGHAAGDQLLCQVATELSDYVGERGLLARLGGDEFGILLTNYSQDNAKALCDSICSKVKSYHFVWEEQVFDIGVSIGLVEINKATDSLDQIINYADLACYAAKDSGRNRAQIYLESDEEIALKSAEVSWVARILTALEEQRLLIYAQLITSVSPDSNHTHFEILVRLRNEDNVITEPAEFLPAAERYNLMTKIDTYVIEQTFISLKQGLFKGLGNTGFVSINLSGQSLSDKSFLEKVTNLMDDYEVNAKQICFEITETSAIKSPQVVRSFMKALNAKGVRFALDDFGTGLSSLTYLKQFPVDYLKIDGSFVRDIIADPVDRKLVYAINQLAHTLNIKTIAEYVESQEILSLLSDMEIDYAQGFFISKPKAVANKFR